MFNFVFVLNIFEGTIQKKQKQKMCRRIDNVQRVVSYNNVLNNNRLGGVISLLLLSSLLNTIRCYVPRINIIGRTTNKLRHVDSMPILVSSHKSCFELFHVVGFTRTLTVTASLRSSKEESFDDGLIISSTSTSASAAVAAIDDPVKEKKRILAEDFVKSIQQEPTLIPSSDGMYVLHDVVNLETDDKYPLIIRKITQPFWNAVIETSTSQLNGKGRNKNRVCAVGTPGIGKTMTTPFLIRILLLEQKHTVVYLIRRPRRDGYYFEFIPRVGENNIETRIDVNVYHEIERNKIASLECMETYFIVDPGKTNDDCDEGSDFRPKVIIVSSPDEKHWGGSEFEKERGGVEGFFKYMPVWELRDLLFAAPYLSDNDPILQDLLNSPCKLNQEILDRYRIFGGVPRHIFGSQSSREKMLFSQDKAISALTTNQVKLLFEKGSRWIDSFQNNQPTSIVMQYKSSIDSNTFGIPETCVASYFVYEKICEKFITYLWRDMMDDKNGKMLEAYIRYLLCRPGERISFKNRPCVDKLDVNYNKPCDDIKLGGCNRIRAVQDPISSALQNPMVIFYCYDENDDDAFPLFHFCYFDTLSNRLVLIQATISTTTHDVMEKSLKELEAKVGKMNVLLCYASPPPHYKIFVTTPADPQKVYNLPLFDIRHIQIMKPMTKKFLVQTEEE
jgi:Retrotransposon hot spot protein